jgi:hypothetical protein
MKNLSTLSFAVAFAFIMLSISDLTAQKNQTTQQPQKVNTKNSVKTHSVKPVSAGKKNVTTRNVAKPENMTANSGNISIKDEKPSNPRPIPVSKPQPVVVAAEPNIKVYPNGSETLLLSKSLRLSNRRCARRENRRCGCRSEIEFVNTTSDTLEMYLGYLSNMETPTIDGVVLPPMRNLYPNFYILPGDSTKLTGGCRGAIRYEARSKRPFRMNDDSWKPRVLLEGYQRQSCMQRTIYLDNR